MDGGETDQVINKYVIQLDVFPVYGYMQTSYNRDQINLDEWSYITPNVEHGHSTLWKGMKQYFNKLLCCIFLN